MNIKSSQKIIEFESPTDDITSLISIHRDTLFATRKKSPCHSISKKSRDQKIMTRQKREKMMALAILLNAIFLIILYTRDHTLRHQVISEKIFEKYFEKNFFLKKFEFSKKNVYNFFW